MLEIIKTIFVGRFLHVHVAHEGITKSKVLFTE